MIEDVDITNMLESTLLSDIPSAATLLKHTQSILNSMSYVEYTTGKSGELGGIKNVDVIVSSKPKNVRLSRSLYIGHSPNVRSNFFSGLGSNVGCIAQIPELNILRLSTDIYTMSQSTETRDNHWITINGIIYIYDVEEKSFRNTTTKFDVGMLVNVAKFRNSVRTSGKVYTPTVEIMESGINHNNILVQNVGFSITTQRHYRKYGK